MRTIRIDFDVNDSVESMRALLKRLFGEGSAESQLTADTVLDCSACGYLGPMAVATLTALREEAAGRGIKISLEPPTKPVLYAYCGYAGLLTGFKIGSVHSSNEGNTTTPVRSFKGHPAGPMEEIVNLVQSQMDLPEEGKTRLQLCLFELAQNVLDHSESTVGGFMSAKAFRNEREVRFAIADMGVGLRRALAQEPRYRFATDKEALRNALIPGVTSKSSTHNMGQGLDTLSSIVKNNGGFLALFSQGARIRVEHAKTDVAGLAPCPPFPGTIAVVRLKIPPPEAGADESVEKGIWR